MQRKVFAVASFAIALTFILTAAQLAAAAPQGVNFETPVSRPQDTGLACLAALTNVVYFPVRLAVTTVTASVGGLVGWLNGGDHQSAQAVWDSTDGQAYITPRILEGHEPLRFGALGAE